MATPDYEKREKEERVPTVIYIPGKKDNDEAVSKV